MNRTLQDDSNGTSISTLDLINKAPPIVKYSISCPMHFMEYLTLDGDLLIHSRVIKLVPLESS